MTTERDYQHQLTQTQSNERSVVDRTVVFDTLYEVVMETIWCPPDTLGKVYPRLTTRKEYGASRETRKDVESVTRDTIYVHDEGVMSEKMSSDIRAPSTMSVVVPWLIILGMIVVAVAVVAVRVMVKRN